MVVRLDNVSINDVMTHKILQDGKDKEQDGQDDDVHLQSSLLKHFNAEAGRQGGAERYFK